MVSILSSTLSISSSSSSSLDTISPSCNENGLVSGITRFECDRKRYQTRLSLLPSSSSSKLQSSDMNASNSSVFSTGETIYTIDIVISQTLSANFFTRDYDSGSASVHPILIVWLNPRRTVRIEMEAVRQIHDRLAVVLVGHQRRRTGEGRRRRRYTTGNRSQGRGRRTVHLEGRAKVGHCTSLVRWTRRRRRREAACRKKHSSSKNNWKTDVIWSKSKK